MSISTLQEKFFNKGCGTVVFGALAVAMVAGIFMRGGGTSDSDRNGGNGAGPVVTVGSFPIPAELFQRQADGLKTQLAQQQGVTGEPTATIQAHALVDATGQVLQAAAVQDILAKEPPTDAEIQAFANTQEEQRIEGARMALEKQGKLKPNASETDLEKALKDQLNGKTLAQIRTEGVKGFVAAYKDPKTKSALLTQYGGPLLVQRYGGKSVGSEQSLRDSYKNYLLHRIFLSSASGAKESPEVRAARADADLKAGKTFESVMDAYSNDPVPPGPGKKVHDATENVAATALDTRPELAALKGKTSGATTGVVDVQGGKAIYGILSVRDDLPKDFEKNKTKLRQEQINRAGQTQVESKVKTILAGSEVKWQNLGYQALSSVADAGTMGYIFDQNAAKKAFAKAQEALKSADGNDRRLATMAMLALTDPQTNTGAKTADVVAERRTALEAAQTAGIEDTALSIEAAALYGDAKEGAKATASLIAASKANHQYNEAGERAFRDIAGKALDLQKKGVLTKEQLQSVQTQQAVWTASRTDNSKAATQAKTDEVSQKAANEAEIARQKAEADKAAAPPSAPAKADESAEIARQKAEASKSNPPKSPAAPAKGSSLLPSSTAGPGR